MDHQGRPDDAAAPRPVGEQIAGGSRQVAPAVTDVVTATFRFHGELNRFVAPQRRDRATPYSGSASATLKHAIEALGVPHTEIGRICLAERDATLDEKLAGEAWIDVYPHDASANRTSIVETDEAMPRFIADAHLGALAAWLRLAGFDTVYDNFFQDDAIAELAASEARIVLTRDRELLKRRAISRGAYVHAQEREAQLREVAERFALASHARPFRLCLRCNAPLQALPLDVAAARVPPRVRERCTRFSTCPVCRRIFWEGSHWRRMRALVDDVFGARDAASERRESGRAP